MDTKAVAAVVLGNALEFYDFIAYSLLAKQIGEAYFPSSSPTASLLSSLLVFWVGFFTRPIGAIIIGAYADRSGRKPAMLITIALMAAGMRGDARPRREWRESPDFRSRSPFRATSCG